MLEPSASWLLDFCWMVAGDANLDSHLSRTTGSFSACGAQIRWEEQCVQKTRGWPFFSKEEVKVPTNNYIELLSILMILGIFTQATGLWPTATFQLSCSLRSFTHHDATLSKEIPETRMCREMKSVQGGHQCLSWQTSGDGSETHRKKIWVDTCGYMWIPYDTLTHRIRAKPSNKLS